MPEDLGFVSYRSRPASVREQKRQVKRFCTARWLMRARKLGFVVTALPMANFFTAGGADN